MSDQFSNNQNTLTENVSDLIPTVDALVLEDLTDPLNLTQERIVDSSSPKVMRVEPTETISNTAQPFLVSSGSSESSPVNNQVKDRSPQSISIQTASSISVQTETPPTEDSPTSSASTTAVSIASSTPHTVYEQTLPELQGLVEGQDYGAHQVIVKFKSDIQTAQANTLQSTLGATTLKATALTGVQLWDIGTRSTADAILALKANPLVEYVEPNYKLSVTGTATSTQPTATPNDPGYNQLWGLHNTGQTGGLRDSDIDAPEAWDIVRGKGVVVGVIDTGIDYTHPDLRNNLWTNPGEIANDGIDNDRNGYIDDYYGYDFANNDSNPFDDVGHGTHVAGTIAAAANNSRGIAGVAPDAKVMALKFLGTNGGSTFDAIEAINYAVMMGADITNNSWGGGGPSQALYDAIANAGSAGQLFIASAGNGGSDGIGDNNDLLPSYPASYDLDNIISVAASDHRDQLGSFSNYGAKSVDLAAPGVNIVSTVPGGYDSYNGTSMAAPHVTGAASLLLSQNPNLTPAQLKERLLSTADPVTGLRGRTVSGGRLNAHQALLGSETQTGAIEGAIWHDLDGDGVRDSNESGLSGWTVYLDQNQNGQLDRGETSTTTNSGGDYGFGNLQPGTYTVAEVLKPGWQQTFPTQPSTAEFTPEFTSGMLVPLLAGETNAFTRVAPSEEVQTALTNNSQTATINVTYNGFSREAQTAFQYAVDIWESLLVSDVPIEIEANWTGLDRGVLGSAGPNQFIRDFAGAVAAGTWHPIAIANKLAGQDLDPRKADISSNFNSDLGNWYFGTDGNTPAGQYDFVSVVLHELGHGLGFVGLMDFDAPSGLGSWGFDSGFPGIYDQFTVSGRGNSLLDPLLYPNPSPQLGLELTSNNIYFAGANAVDANNGFAPKLYAPRSWQGGSSYSHLDEDTYRTGNPNSLMTPQLGQAEAIHTPGAIGLGMLEDMGWTIATDTPAPPPSVPGAHTVTVGAGETVRDILFGNQQTDATPPTSGNFSFETGDFTGWTPFGDAQVVSSNIGIATTDGRFQAQVTTGDGSFSIAQLEALVKLDAGLLQSTRSGNIREGSVIQLTSFEVEAGDTLSFDWNFLTNENTPNPDNNDFAFVTFNNNYVFELGDTSTPDQGFDPLVFTTQSGYQTAEFIFNQAGTYTMAIGVMDEGDTGVDSGLLVDNVQLLSVNGLAEVVQVSATTHDPLLAGGLDNSVSADIVSELAWNWAAEHPAINAIQTHGFPTTATDWSLGQISDHGLGQNSTLGNVESVIVAVEEPLLVAA
ncbi:S8 family serine peptidase [Leptothoe sp. PORK10 BA2]|uniref:S8 family serine peptidase n=1 Tax=Leptothoe sp. PORK10 BA2 TaxID=3110254 RepID=UPI002B1FD413|nr:S8 family serine peptidase [Leptothoe sp. PORK10 BA2]MEA5464589.1 S8 family serine peptidase [Leptothoe sp. PORK10 BA2]